MRIYMDACCLNRPFDDLSQDRVYLEAEAVLAIVSHCEKGDWILISSGAIDFELSRLSDMDRFEQVQVIYAAAKERINISPEAEQRAAILQQQGLKPFDSLHVALAEMCCADVFLTTDDRLIKIANRVKFNVKVSNPIIWIMEATEYEL